MTVEETIQTLSDLRDNPEMDLSLQEFQAIAIARVILISLDPSQLGLINSILAMPDASSN